MRGRTLVRRAGAIVGVVVVLASGLLWGATATGQVAYVSTRGSSMEPQLSQGDLAVVRPADSYGVGDVVAYRSELLDTVVLHRIVERTDEGYVLQGDNNDFLDADHPSDADVIGVLWTSIPEAGHALGWIRDHLMFLAAGIIGIGATGTAAVAERRRRKRRPRARQERAPARSPLQAWRAATIGFAVIAAACAAVGGIAHIRSSVDTTTTSIAYSQQGAFSYRASAPDGPVYDDGRVDTGDPVYLRLVPTLGVAFDYTVVAGPDDDVAGTIALAAEVADGTGWSRRIELEPAERFDGTEARVDGRLDLEELLTLLAEVREATGIQSGTATITVLPEIELDATVAGAPVRTHFDPRLQFLVDPLQLRLAAASPEDDPLHPTAAGTVELSSSAPARLELFGQRVDVRDARVALFAAIPLALAAAIAAIVLRRRLRGEVARIELRHGHRIVSVAGADSDATRAFVNVTTMEDLARLAEQEGCLILHQRTDGRDVYAFQSDQTIYRYVPSARVPSRRHASA